MKARFDYLFFLLHYSTYHRRTPPLHLLTLSRVSPVSDVRGYIMLQYNTALNLVTYNMHSYLPITLLFTVCFQDLGRCSSSLKSIFLIAKTEQKENISTMNWLFRFLFRSGKCHISLPEQGI